MNDQSRFPNAFEHDKPGTDARDRAEEAIERLRQRGGFFVDAVRATRMAMVLTDPTLPGNPIVFANRSFLDLTGYRMEEVLGQQPFFMNGLDTDPDDAARFARILDEDRDEVIETVQYAKDGRRFVATVLLSAFKNDAGQTINHFLSWLDVTRRVAAESEVADLRLAALALRASEVELTEEIRNTRILRDLGTRLVTEENLQTVYAEVLAAAMEITRAQAGAVQLLEPATEELVAIAMRGFSPEVEQYLHCVDARSHTSYGRALRTGERRYFIFDPRSTDASVRMHVEDGVLSAQSTPLVSRSGRPMGMLSTYWRSAHRPAARVFDVFDVLVRQAADLLERNQAQAALRESEGRFQQFAAAYSGALFIRDAASLKMEYASAATAALYGVEPDELLDSVQSWAAHIVPEDRDRALEHVERVRRGESATLEFRIRRLSDKTLRWIREVSFALRDERGNVQRVGSIAEDVTEAKLAVEHQAVLLAELQHRVRNSLAIVRAITARTAESAVDVADYAARMSGRLLALARVQALLTKTANPQVDLRSIVRDEIGAQTAHEGQYVVEGADVQLSAKEAEVLTLALHELATNALKYGALSVPDGMIEVRWRIVERQGRPWLDFRWTERGVPQRESPTGKPRRRGFGSELIEERIPYELEGRGHLVIEPGGARCHLEIPLQAGGSVLETGAPQRALGAAK